MGIVSTRWATPKDAGSAATTWCKKDRIAAKRALCMATELFRFLEFQEHAAGNYPRPCQRQEWIALICSV